MCELWNPILRHGFRRPGLSELSDGSSRRTPGKTAPRPKGKGSRSAGSAAEASPSTAQKKDPETSPELEGEIEGIKAGDEEDGEKIIEDAAELGDESEDVTKVIDTVIVVDEN